MKVDIIKGYVSKDHVHLLLSIPPQQTISRLVQKLKGKSSYQALSRFEHLKKTFWGHHLWARGYFVQSSGHVTDETIKAYLENQKHDDDDFQIEC